ncbi:hypothetical protein BD626DRAFT_433440 [Schizophyllum amplum]|uniref:BTB domain-containing protein n=1 Tax=Schizophyllum amplum TaxID=97359 RepID=A0A550CB54_9AGAR|nr:hypothetical protein BD626DRAFT_433440 [Auriculariopsis ampla]
MNQPELCERAAKRQRTDEGETSVIDEVEASAAAATRHSKHWYRDGSIVLHVDDVLFRVHQTTLERLSDFFKDLFGVPQPEGEEQVEGCLVVRLGGDKCVDWVHLLDAMYDNLYFDSLASQTLGDSFPSTSSILRLATKYLIIAYRRKCITILSRHFPSRAIFQPKDFNRGITPNQCGDMISLGRELNLLALLPSAYLLLVTYPAANPTETADVVYSVVSISPHDKNDIYHGTLGLITAQADALFPFAHTFTPPDDCEQGDCSPCPSFAPLHRQPCVIHFFNKGEFTALKSTICEVCRKKLKEIYREGRQKTWERLPEIFRLGKDWDELRRIQDNDGTMDL